MASDIIHDVIPAEITPKPLWEERAFTLAEVLISLAVIGIVAAMTIPTLIHKYQAKYLKSQLVKTYSTLKQAIDMEYAETGIPVNYTNYSDPSNSSAEKQKLLDVLKKHLHIYKDCGMYSCLDYTRDSSSELGYYGFEQYKTYSKSGNISTKYFDDGQFILKNGTLIMLENNRGSFILITADINGVEQGPNVWGQDLFTFQLTDNGLFPMGAEGTKYTSDTYCSKTSTDGLNGIGCTYRALYDTEFWE